MHGHDQTMLFGTWHNMFKKEQVWTLHSLGVLIKARAPDEVVHDQQLAPCQLTLLNRGPPASSKTHWGMLHFNNHKQTVSGLQIAMKCLCKIRQAPSSCQALAVLQESIAAGTAAACKAG